MIASSYHAETADMTLTIGKINAILKSIESTKEKATMARNPYDPLVCIPSPDAIRRSLTETETLAGRLRILLRVSEQITAADGKKVVTDDQKKEDSLIPPSAALLPPPSKLRERLAIAHREVDLLRRLIRIAESGRPYPHPTSDHGETSI